MTHKFIGWSQFGDFLYVFFIKSTTFFRLHNSWTGRVPLLIACVHQIWTLKLNSCWRDKTNNSKSFHFCPSPSSGDDLHCRVLEHGDKPLDDRAANPRVLLRLQEQVREKVPRTRFRCTCIATRSTVFGSNPWLIRYRPPRLQWHRFQWHTIATVTVFLNHLVLKSVG